MDNRPVDLVGILQFLDRLSEFGGVTKFKQRYCGLKQNRGKGGRTYWSAGEAHNLPELGQLLRSSFMIRRLKKDVLKDLPELQTSVYKIDVDNWDKYKRAEDDVVKFVYSVALVDKKFAESLPATMSDDERAAAIYNFARSKERSALRAKALVQMNVLRQLAGEGTRKGCIEWIDNFRESGNKLVAFAWYKESQEAFKQQYPDAATVCGDDNSKKRNEEIKRFQEDERVGTIICSIMAASEAITLTAASDIFVAELPWTPTKVDQLLARCHRSGQKNTVNGTFAIGRSTINEDIYAVIEEKRKVCVAVLDGGDQELSAIDNIMYRLLDRRGL